MKTVTLLLLGALIAGLTGCASSSPSASATTAPADVNGMWTGNTQTSARTVSLQLQQTGTKVTGTLSGAGVADGPVAGVVQGNTIKLAQKEGFGTTPWLDVNGDQMRGDLGSGNILTLRRVR